MAIMDWRMTKRGYYIHPRLPGQRAGIVSEQDKTGLWRFAVRERATGAVVRVGDSYPTAAAAMDAAEAVGAPGQPNSDLAGQVMDFLQDKQGGAERG